MKVWIEWVVELEQILFCHPVESWISVNPLMKRILEHENHFYLYILSIRTQCHHYPAITNGWRRQVLRLWIISFASRQTENKLVITTFSSFLSPFATNREMRTNCRDKNHHNNTSKSLNYNLFMLSIHFHPEMMFVATTKQLHTIIGIKWPISSWHTPLLELLKWWESIKRKLTDHSLVKHWILISYVNLSVQIHTELLYNATLGFVYERIGFELKWYKCNVFLANKRIPSSKSISLIQLFYTFISVQKEME